MYEITKMPSSIDIGFTGEKLFREIQIDMTKWMEEMPEGVPSIVYIRPGDTPNDAYIPITTFANNILTWNIEQDDLGGIEGSGVMQVWLEETENTTLVKRGKSAVVTVRVNGSITDPGDTDPPARTMLLNLEAEAEGLPAGSDPTAEWEHEGYYGDYTLKLGIPKGDKGDKGDQGDPAPAEQVTTAVDAYLAENFSNPSNPPLDRTLASSSSAAPADMVGSLKSAFEEVVDFGLFPNNLVVNDECVDNAYININQNGAIKTGQSGYFCTGYIPVTEGVRYKANHGRNCWFYDSSKAGLSGVTGTSIQTGVTAPTDAAYIRFTINKETDGINNPELLYFTTVDNYDTNNIWGCNITSIVDSAVDPLEKSSGVDKIEFTNGCYIATNTTVININNKTYDSSFACAVVDIRDVKELYLHNIVGGSAANAVAFIDDDGNRLMLLGNVGEAYNGAVGVPEGAYYAVLNNNTSVSVGGYAYKGVTVNRIKRMINEIILPNTVKVTRSDANLFNPNEIVENCYVNKNNGKLVDGDGYFSSGYISVTEEETYKANIGNRQFAWYNSDKEYIDGGSGLSSGITAPENAAYIRFSISKSNDTNNPWNVCFAEIDEFDDSVQIEKLKIHEEQIEELSELRAQQEDGHSNMVSVDGATDIFELSIVKKPTQNGSGDPSPENIRHIRGYSGIGIYTTGKNLFDSDTLYKGYFKNTNVNSRVASDAYRTVDINMLPPGKYIVYTNIEDPVYSVRCYVDGEITGLSVSVPYYEFTAETYGKFAYCFRMVDGYNFPEDIKVCVIKAEDNELYLKKEFPQYVGKSYALNFPNTISLCSGFNIDPVNGTVTGTYALKIITGANIYSQGTSTGGVNYVEIRNMADNILLDDGEAYCNMYKPYFSTSDRQSGDIAIDSDNKIYIYDSRFTSLETAQGILNTTNVRLAYKYETPIVGTVDKINIDIISNNMNVWNDASDIDSIKYYIAAKNTYDTVKSLAEHSDDSKHLNILVFGHSYASDCWGYVPFILKEYGITVNLYMYYRGNDSIYRFVQEWNDTGVSGLDEWGNSHMRRLYHVDTRKSLRWDDSQGLTGYSPKMCLELANDPTTGIGHWDIITLQTAPTDVFCIKAATGGNPQKGYDPYVRQAIKLINDSYHKPYSLGWFCSYTRILPIDQSGYPPVTGEEFDNRIDALRAAETIWMNEPFEFVIPAAAAVFSARTNANLASTSVSDIGNLWYSDAVHIQNGIPRYIGNLTVVESLFRKFFPKLSVIGDQTRITNAWIQGKSLPTRTIHGDVLATDEYLYDLAQKCVVAACEHPFDITPIYDVDDPTQLEFQDERPSRYWADALIDTSNIDNGQLTQQSEEA